jgi:hypothetical protein
MSFGAAALSIFLLGERRLLAVPSHHEALPIAVDKP